MRERGGVAVSWVFRTQFRRASGGRQSLLSEGFGSEGFGEGEGGALSVAWGFGRQFQKASRGLTEPPFRGV